ncbi:hypothetical protein CPHO_00020 [Corynebacterium phocae]|uniref:Uncharacterized protein n=1 Tax=Corynebacterium phocae TaxID=161895 RepID=A0A1L7D0H0_9CORY|nr:DciA family protein [Corynebacterium phocae]APT91587.1 hypothetical protein CPHO_00020 [Corynebacterium phocae]KAA8720654.1 DUF721 domain-containing protein [Corynebacterium phocae]
MSDPDFITNAVQRARALSKNPPRLSQPVAKMKSLDDRAAKKAVRRLGRETGLDGRAKRRGIGVPKLADILQDTIQERGWQEELGQGWIFGNWEELVGASTAAHTKPEKIEHNILHISCDNSNWATNLRYLQGEILKKIAAKAGDGVVVQLRIHGPKQHRNYQGPMWVKPQGSNDTYG